MLFLQIILLCCCLILAVKGSSEYSRSQESSFRDYAEKSEAVVDDAAVEPPVDNKHNRGRKHRHEQKASLIQQQRDMAAAAAAADALAPFDTKQILAKAMKQNVAQVKIYRVCLCVRVIMFLCLNKIYVFHLLYGIFCFFRFVHLDVVFLSFVQKNGFSFHFVILS